MTPAAPTTGAALSPDAVREAAQWLVRLNGADVRPDDWQALDHWRAQAAAHEAAWQRAQRLVQLLDGVPADVGLPVLGRQRRVARRTLLRAAGLLAVPGSAWFAWRTTPWEEWVAAHRTATGERRDLALADGSRVALNTGTALDVRIDAEQRLLRLHAGEILVETAPDARPFRVATPMGVLRALGTRFGVRLDDDRAHLVVTEGAVEASPRHGPARVIRAGEQTTMSSGQVQAAQPSDAGALAWERGMLLADAMRLDEFLRQLARYRPGVLRCDPAVARLRVSGAFRVADTDYVLTLLQTTLPIQVQMRSRWWTTVVPT